MKKKDLVAVIAEESKLTKKDSEMVLDIILNTIKAEVKKGEKVTLLGFGNFEPKTNSARKGINPSTKEVIQIKASNSVKFKVGKAFKESLN